MSPSTGNGVHKFNGCLAPSALGHPMCNLSHLRGCRVLDACNPPKCNSGMRSGTRWCNALEWEDLIRGVVPKNDLDDAEPRVKHGWQFQATQKVEDC